jgi:hypothetical protein
VHWPGQAHRKHRRYADTLRRDGRAAECEALEKPWDASPRGFESLSLRRFFRIVDQATAIIGP